MSVVGDMCAIEHGHRVTIHRKVKPERNHRGGCFICVNYLLLFDNLKEKYRNYTKLYYVTCTRPVDLHRNKRRGRKLLAAGRAQKYGCINIESEKKRFFFVIEFN